MRWFPGVEDSWARRAGMDDVEVVGLRLFWFPHQFGVVAHLKSMF